MIEGFDASGWTGSIDFRAAKAAGKQYAIYRVGRGKPDGATNSQGIDNFWFQNKAGSISSGLKTGGYWRFFPDEDLSRQVDRFCLALGQRDGMLSPWVDVEDTGGYGPTDLTSWVIAALRQVEQKCGRRPILYTGKNFYDNNLEYWRLSNWELCIAWQTTGKWREYGSCFWQYKLDTPVPWAQGRVDLQKYAFDDLRYNTFNNDLRYQIDEDGMLHGPMMWNDKLLPEANQQGPQRNQVAIIHTMVGYLNGTDSLFRNNSDLESHLGIGGRYDGIQLDGAIYQWMPSWARADANYDANPYAFSIETSDGGGNRYLEEWSSMQAESIAQCLAAWCLKYDKPARLVNRSSSSVPGIGHHKIGTIPGPQVPPDDWWSNPALGYRACPGQTRINQLTTKTIPRVQAILASLNNGGPGGPGTPPEDPDMQLGDIVGIDNSGNPITVRDCLLAAYQVKDVIASAGKINKEQFDNLMGSIHTANDQMTWGDLATKKWDEVTGKRYG